MADLRPNRREDFTVAIICALPLEYNAVSLLFDKFWDEDGDHYGRAAGDPNSYTTGRIGKYDVVLALLPHMGKVNAASSAASIRSSYGGLQLALLVGICGGVPRSGMGSEEEILLSDVVISKTVVQYDLGKRYPDKFLRKNTVEDNLSKPNKDVRNLLVTFETDLGLDRLQQSTAKYLKQLQANAAQRKRGGKYQYPGTVEDKLFASSYRHKHQSLPNCVCRDCHKKSDPVCDEALKSVCDELGCDKKYLVARERLQTKQPLERDNKDEVQEPAIWIGSVASGDTVMKSGEDRDEIARNEGVIAFEMEGAGVWEEVPCIVVKGVCDYADSHKSDKWQNFAAATAASASKAILERYIRTDRVRILESAVSGRESITQGGSKYSSDVKGRDVTQGNQLQVSTPQVPRDYTQGGSEFGGNIQGEASVVQGNKFTI
ncbi:phosphorylase superfamily protein [Coleophoma crateriformis]|uniref:Phosphorylase superfamily protein n=1 Tax=Coleophoma crateriformis TaxID=565419 RepID=A0A3D8SLY7_9HELO|nr:phosphorylase superfamily protein [Coleophoma crateriformis]